MSLRIGELFAGYGGLGQAAAAISYLWPVVHSLEVAA